MKNQYVGDIGDYGKYGLLRFLATHGIKIGINWYLTDDDGSSDGRFTNYLKNPKERYYDPELFDALGKIAFREDKTVRMIEDAGLIPGAVFYDGKLKTGILEVNARKWDRRLWYNNSTLLLQDADLIFADPDNGISFRKTSGHKGSEKYVLPEEVSEYYSKGRDVVYYCHKGRRKQEDWEQAKVEIRQYIRDAQILAVTCHRGTQRSYIFVLHPDSYRRYESLITEFIASVWGNMFTREPVSGNIDLDSMKPDSTDPHTQLEHDESVRDAALTATAFHAQLEPLDIRFSVCKVSDYSGVDLERPFVFTASTDEEKSLVCPVEFVPDNTVIREDGWKAFRVCGTLDFSLIGILARIAGIMADNGISIFAISTYNTDYILTKEESFDKALSVLREKGWLIRLL